MNGLEELGQVRSVKVSIHIEREEGADRRVAMEGRAGLIAMVPTEPEGRAYVYVGGRLWSEWVEVLAGVLRHAGTKHGFPILSSALTSAALKDRRILEAMHSAIMAYHLITAHDQENDHGA